MWFLRCHEIPANIHLLKSRECEFKFFWHSNFYVWTIFVTSIHFHLLLLSTNFSLNRISYKFLSGLNLTSAISIFHISDNSSRSLRGAQIHMLPDCVCAVESESHWLLVVAFSLAAAFFLTIECGMLYDLAERAWIPLWGRKRSVCRDSWPLHWDIFHMILRGKTCSAVVKCSCGSRNANA